MSSPKAPFTPPSPDASRTSLDSDKLLELPVFQLSGIPKTGCVPLKLPLTLSYALLLLLSIAYLTISGYASFWRTSSYIGAIAGLNSVFFSFVLVVVCAKPIHPLARPHSSSLGVRVWATVLAVGWAVTVTVILSYIGAKRRWPSPGPTRALVFVELAASIVAFFSSTLVAALQVAQHGRCKKTSGG